MLKNIDIAVLLPVCLLAISLLVLIMLAVIAWLQILKARVVSKRTAQQQALEDALAQTWSRACSRYAETGEDLLRMAVNHSRLPVVKE